MLRGFSRSPAAIGAILFGHPAHALQHFGPKGLGYAPLTVAYGRRDAAKPAPHGVGRMGKHLGNLVESAARRLGRGRPIEARSSGVSAARSRAISAAVLRALGPGSARGSRWLARERTRADAARIRSLLYGTAPSVPGTASVGRSEGGLETVSPGSSWVARGARAICASAWSTS